jgi:hypothetical protein
MNVTSTEQAKGGIQVTQPTLQTNTEFRAMDHLASNFVREAQPGPRHVGYGLPCSKCGTYYMADQSLCPICKCDERISPTTIPARADLQNAHRQINTAASSHCSLEENHLGCHEPAAICRPCYDHLQERVDLMEAALHMDLKEAAQIVYEAVWSDPSDPRKTYQNAAQALLTELRELSGITRFTESARVV